jgi:hypothetical protein
LGKLSVTPASKIRLLPSPHMGQARVFMYSTSFMFLFSLLVKGLA